MDFFTHSPGEYTDHRRPRRVYGLIDRVEPESPGPLETWWLSIECIDADWFDHLSINRGDDSYLKSNLPVSVIEMAFMPMEELLKNTPREENLWIELDLTDIPSGKPIEHYMNLYSPPLIRYVNSVLTVDHLTLKKLNDSASMDHYPQATDLEIQNLISLDTITSAAVYDVGQGNCNALLSNNYPVLYFDFGGGVLGNKHTFPSGLNRFCFIQNPTIVLSHLDWDHWSSINIDTEAKEQSWIVPKQKTGHVHRKMLSELFAKNNLHIWPDNLSEVTSLNNKIKIVKCTGAGRNHSGLALWVSNQDETERMLFTGDCRYSAIPGTKDIHANVTSAIVPHHGGKMSSPFTVPSLNRNHSRLVYSYGQNNKYQHPHLDTLDNHKHWRSPLKTSDRRNLKPGVELGHTYIYWDENDPDYESPCDNDHCDLHFVSR